MVVVVLVAIDQSVLLHWLEQRLVSLLFVVVSARATAGGSPVGASVHRCSSLVAASGEKMMEKGDRREEEGQRGEESDVSSYSRRRWRTKMGGCLVGDGGQRRDEEEEKRVGCGGSREKKNEEFRFGSFGRLK
ncbi:hypothetical protein KY285_001096 [Solanum tuberosum]|nr:hypothetical protein KY285_001096 [Solanum tuberosum]